MLELSPRLCNKRGNVCNMILKGSAMNAETPILKAKDAPDLGQFDWSDPLRLNEQLSEDERMIMESSRAYATEKLQPRVINAFANEETDASIFREMGDMGLLGVTVP